MNNILETINNSKPLRLYEPNTLIIFLTFYSPIIIITSIFILSIVSQNFKGIIYLLYLIAALLGREFIYWLFNFYGKNKNIQKTNNNITKNLIPGQTGGSNDICNSIQYSIYGNPSFSAFVFSFTIFYLFIPMFMNGNPNFWIFSFIIFYFFLDMGIKIYKKCVVDMGDLFLNVLVGGALATAIVMSMYAGNSSEWLLFAELISNKQFCSMPSKQSFKCSVFKNGELIGSM
jgi:hypothetical protein